MFSHSSIQSSQCQNGSQNPYMPEQQLQSMFENQHQQTKGFIDSFEDLKEIIKKYHSAMNILGNNLNDLAKRERTSPSDQPLESINSLLSTFLGLFSQNIKSVATYAFNQLEAVRSKLEGIRNFKVQMKKNYDDQNKQYQKLKKEYKQSKEKMDDIKNKLDEFKKMNDQKDPQYILLKHQYKYASHEVKARQQNKLECNQAFQSFLLDLIVQKDNLMESYVMDASTKIESNFKHFKDALVQSSNKFEQFLRPLMLEVTRKVSEKASQSQIRADEDKSNRSLLKDSSLNPISIICSGNQRIQSKSKDSKNLQDISNYDDHGMKQSPSIQSFDHKQNKSQRSSESQQRKKSRNKSDHSVYQSFDSQRQTGLPQRKHLAPQNQFIQLLIDKTPKEQEYNLKNGHGSSGSMRDQFKRN